MKLSVVTPYYDDIDEATATLEKVRQSVSSTVEVQFITIDAKPDASLPCAKNQGVRQAMGDLILFSYSGIFPAAGSVQTLLSCFDDNPRLAAVGGRWSNARGKVEVGYNVRRMPTLTALLFDILLLNKFFAANRVTRRYKMRDFDHDSAIVAEHVTDCVFMVRRDLIDRCGGFDERYAPGWFDQLEFCHVLRAGGHEIRFEPAARFVSNDRAPLINRIVADQYTAFRNAELLYIRRHFGNAAWRLARICVVIGMVERLLFSLTLPQAIRRWFIGSYRVYVNDEYIRKLRSAYWCALKESIFGPKEAS